MILFFFFLLHSIILYKCKENKKRFYHTVVKVSLSVYYAVFPNCKGDANSVI